VAVNVCVNVVAEPAKGSVPASSSNKKGTVAGGNVRSQRCLSEHQPKWAHQQKEIQMLVADGLIT
jgi:hypothetical protein